MERIYSAHKTQRNLSTLDKPKSFNTVPTFAVGSQGTQNSCKCSEKLGKYNGAGKYDGL